MYRLSLLYQLKDKKQNQNAAVLLYECQAWIVKCLLNLRQSIVFWQSLFYNDINRLFGEMMMNNAVVALVFIDNIRIENR